ncbi:hypothetical protein CCM_03369 [Cordyceps militaris CM01]|uniref:Uncharacterized protein n=1 Tax=Cordyceps militaris (strain CM01) TaxID=983644 RepID=G3JAC9_CORMM|nr:uncharacterized protein CCM_03369 [Cordyceps militaris CM01]EGX95097.1 hypothetical protein CCM_03369 [Cordyceps militaris CM01]
MLDPSPVLGFVVRAPRRAQIRKEALLPIMFGRKHAAPVQPAGIDFPSNNLAFYDHIPVLIMYVVRSPQPLTKETANANAATAAASAFMRRASDASLSSAAAAAALRSRPTSPTNVADVQSKRLSRRSPSVSSSTGKRRELTRTPSVGSMMERTFRSPSPGRSPAPVSYDVPPIPSIPNTDKPSSRPNSSSRKGSAGLQTQNFRTASEKMRDGQKGSWFAAAAAHDLHTVRRTASELQLSSTRAPSEPRPGSVSPSINFSYPRARLHSPSRSLSSLQSDDQPLVYDPNSRRMVPRAQLEARSQATYEEYEQVIERPQTKKKQSKQPKELKQPRLSRAGSHLSRGTVARTKAPVLESDEVPELQSPPIAALEPQPDREMETEIDASLAKPKTKKKKKRQTQPTALAVPELAATETPHSSIPESIKAEQPFASAKSNAVRSSPMENAAKSCNVANGATPSPHAKSKVKAVASREPSESPARSARFAASTDQLVVRHEPPSRSLSPRKSALKHSSPTRAVSPSDDGSDVSAAPGSLASPDEARKKSFRVSWDDRSTVVVSEPITQHAAEQAASSSPQTKKSWHSIIGKGSRKDAVSVEKEETMSPRPALPSFGSVREKKPKEQEERPLVRPEHVVQNEIPTAAAAAAATASTALPIAPNTSKPREPLPVGLPSVGKEEEASSSEDGLMEDTSDDDVDSEVEADSGANGVSTKSNQFSGNAVPTIAVSHASPLLPQTEQHEQVVSVSVDDDESSSGSGELDFTDGHSNGTVLLMDDIKEEEEEIDMYSDAYEEIAEPEGDGFLSLDAVLESPTSSPNAKNANGKPIAEKKELTAAETVDRSDTPDDWENAKAYWKSLSSAKRRQLECEAMEEGEETSPGSPQSANTNLRKSAKANAETTTPTKKRLYQVAPSTSLSYNSTPEATPTHPESKANGSSMRKSMRESQSNGVQKSEPRKLGGSLRKSMRPEQPVSADTESLPRPLAGSTSPTSAPRVKRSLRHNSVNLSSLETRPSVSATDRPASYHAPVNSTSSTKHTKSLRANGSASAESAMQGAGMKTTLRRRGSDSSESSFTRARAGSASTHEFRSSMRGSMRQPPATADETALRARRDSASSLPTGSSFGAGRLRQSLRGESADPPTRRRMPGFGKSTPTKSKKGKSNSRFDDSSDEEEGYAGINFFQSRFADSSSEDDEPQTKSKGKGIPKSLRTKSNARAASSAIVGPDSPMLDNAALTQSQLTQVVGSPVTGRGPLPLNEDADKPFRPQHSRRGSFISLLRRKKDSANRVTRDLTEAAARQNVNLERSPQELEALRNTPLHKRGPSWPLPEPTETTAFGADHQHSPDRPSTAGDAVINTSSNKSKFMRRRSASHSMVPADTADMDDDLVTDAVPQKKKKFGALRKMFGLHD